MSWGLCSNLDFFVENYTYNHLSKLCLQATLLPTETTTMTMHTFRTRTL